MMKFIKSVWFLIKIAAVIYAIIWVSKRPGIITIDWLGTRVDITIGFALLMISITVALLCMGYYWWRRLISLPRVWRDHKKSQYINKGYTAINRGLLAVAAGDDGLAARHAKRARALLPDKPLTKLLSAQSALMNGDQIAAKNHFTALLEDPEGAFFGIRGLLTRALNDNDRPTALKMARTAYDQQPKRPWVLKTLFELEAQSRHWDKAMTVLSRAQKYDVYDRKTADEHRAALLAAMSDEAASLHSSKTALSHIKSALRYRSDFVPFIARYITLLAAEDKIRPAQNLLKKAWKKNPHPKLARLWMSFGATSLGAEQVKWAEKLTIHNPPHIESRILLARIALGANLWGVARTQLMHAISAGDADQRVYDLLAKLEKKEHNDNASANQWLGKMANAPVAALWVSMNTGNGFDQWSPIAPDDEAFNNMQWRVPFSTHERSQLASSLSTTHGAAVLPPSIIDGQDI